MNNEEKEILKKLNCEIVKIPLDAFVKLVGESKSKAWKATKEALEKLVKGKEPVCCTFFSLHNSVGHDKKS